jgi:imidazolonepropionase-like amidohydrolase
MLSASCKDNVNDDFPHPIDPNGEDGPPPPPAGIQPHKNLNPQPKITECSAKIASSGSEVCKVTKTGSGGQVIRGTILGPEEVLHKGEILVDARGVITCAACDCSDSPGYASATVVSCPSGVISPGMVNPHEHLTFQNAKPVPHGTERYENRFDWRSGYRNGHKPLDDKLQGGGANVSVRAHGELRYLMSGVTTIAGGGGVPGLIRNVDTSQEDLEGLPALVASSDVDPMKLAFGSKPAATGCDFERRTNAAFVNERESYLPHISEGIDLESHNEFVCASAAGSYDVLRGQTAIIHAVALNAADAASIRKERAKVVWSPRTNVDLYGNTAQAVMLDLAGVPLSLGTDWIASGSMNMLRELRCADELNQKYFDKHFTDADLWRMATINGAFAVGASHAIGMLKPGYLADIAVYDGRTSKDFRAVLDAGVEDVALVLRGGRAMYGDDAVVKALGDQTCTSFPTAVCGKEKAVCIDVRASKNAPNLDTILAEGTKYYPTYFCKDKPPEGEPSCVPTRANNESFNNATVYNGIPTDDDKDGDGIPDVQDNCPLVFNPIRPMDKGRQGDADRDGIGDACDECPNDKEQKCTRPVAGDLDGDGVPNGIDNCPDVANPEQEDRDHDARGDACDSCPVANPGAEACPLAISAVRNPASSSFPKFRTVVAVEGFVSFRKTNDLLYIQEGQTGAAWQGIRIEAGDLAGTLDSGPLLGQKIRVVGRTGETFTIAKVEASNITFSGDPVGMTPLTVTSDTTPSTADVMSAAGGEPYESLLVTMPGPHTIEQDTPDRDKATNEVIRSFLLILNEGAQTLRLGDAIFDRYGTKKDCTPAPCAYPPEGFTKGTTFSSLTGIMGIDFGTRRLFPRNTADLGR